MSCIYIEIQSFSSLGKLPPSLNNTIIKMVPKIDHPKTPSHFRPVSLIKTIYKAISKILVHILAFILQKGISPFQKAFTQDRSILIIKKFLTSFKHPKMKQAGALKLVMEKDYDHIE